MAEEGGENAEGEYAEGEYAEGEYAEGEYAEGEYYGEGEGEGEGQDEDSDEKEGWINPKKIKGPPPRLPPKRPEDMEKEIQERKDTWSQKYDTGRDWSENVGEAVYMTDNTTKEVYETDDFDLKGTKIEEKIEIEKTIGRGTFSVVKLGKYKSSGEHVAIKITNEQLAPEFTLKDLKEQVENLKGIEHPNIVHYKEHFEVSNSLCIVLSLAKGGEILKKFSSNTNAPWNEHISQKITKQVLEAVQFLHEKKILHLHITHQNLFLSGEDENSPIILGGFSLSKKQGEESSVKGGNIYYQAPEILTQSGCSTETDMWSVGVLVFLLLTGKLAFFDNNRMKRNLKISKANYTIDSHLSDNAKKFIASLLVPERGSRISAHNALQHSWMKENAPQTNLSLVRGLFAKIE